VQMHSHDYKGEDPEFFRDKHVVVLGMGNSAMDIAVEASFSAAHVHLAARRGAHVVPKYLFGRPIDQIATHPHTPVRLASKLLGLALRLHSGPPERYGLQRPDHRLDQAHPTISGRILDAITHGGVAPHPNIERLGPDWVRFADGTQVHADVVIYCTGYRISFPFFDEGFFATSDNRVELFQRVFSPAHPSLAFVGLIQPIGATMPIAEAQGRLLAGYLRGEYHLPSRARMLAAIRRADAAMRRRYVASQRHTIQVDFDRYLHDLERERRRGARRAEQAGRTLPVSSRAGSGATGGRPVAA